MTEETLQVNSQNIIFENRIKSNKPSANIIFLTYLLQVCMRRMITTISSGSWPFTAGDLRAVWECTDKYAQESKVRTQLIIAVQEMALFLRGLWLREPSIVSFPHNPFLQSSLEIDLNRNIELKIKALDDFKKCKYGDCSYLK